MHSLIWCLYVYVGAAAGTGTRRTRGYHSWLRRYDMGQGRIAGTTRAHTGAGHTRVKGTHSLVGWFALFPSLVRSFGLFLLWLGAPLLGGSYAGGGAI